MRKNGINRALIEIDGGVCAPSGFTASAIRCNFLHDGANHPDFALILGKKRYATAYLSPESVNMSSFAKLSQKHVEKSLSSAVIIQSGVACGYGEKEDVLAEKVTRLFAPALKIDRNEMLLASIGQYGKELELTPFEIAAKNIVAGLGNATENSLAVAKTLEGNGKQVSYSFEIGDVTCKIGAVFSGSIDGALICVLTTDVSISSEMLQKALKAVANEQFYMLGGRVPTPNDCICAMASGEANNWKITENNSDYQKFFYALNSVSERICRIILQASGEIFTCKVLGVKSKNSAREIAKAVVSATSIQKSLSNGHLDTQKVLSVVLGGMEKIALHKVSIAFSSSNMEVVTFEDNLEMPIAPETEKHFFFGENLQIIIHANEGNYSSIAYGNFDAPIRA